MIVTRNSWKTCSCRIRNWAAICLESSIFGIPAWIFSWKL